MGQFTPVSALYDPFGVDVPLNFDITHSLTSSLGGMLNAVYVGLGQTCLFVNCKYIYIFMTSIASV